MLVGFEPRPPDCSGCKVDGFTAPQCLHILLKAPLKVEPGGGGGTWPTNIWGGATGKSKKLPCPGVKFLKMIPFPAVKFS